MNIIIAKACITVSNGALCVITGLIPIHTEIEETAKYYEIIKGQGNQLDHETEIQRWAHPAHVVEITDGQEDSRHNIRVYTDGSKSEQVVIQPLCRVLGFRIFPRYFVRMASMPPYTIPP
jgi:hypothetical protein